MSSPREIPLPDGRTLTLSGNETPEQLTALKKNLRERFPEQKQEEKAPEQEEKGFVGRIGERLEKRGETMREAQQASLAGQQGSVEGGFQILGQGVLGAADVVGETIVSGAKALTPKPVEEAVAKTAQFGLETLGKLPTIGEGTLGEELSADISKVSEYLDKNPRLARNLGIVEAAAVVTPVGKAKIKPKAQTGIIGKTGEALTDIAEKAPLKAPKVSGAIGKLGERARELGIPLRADQILPTKTRKGLQKGSELVPLSGARQFAERQQAAWHRALSRTIGQNSDHLGPDVVNKYLDSAKKKFDNILEGKKIEFSDDLVKTLDDIESGLTKTLDDASANVVKNNINEVRKNFGLKSLKGKRAAIKELEGGIVTSTKEMGALRKEIAGIKGTMDALEGEVTDLAKLSNKQLGLWRRKTITDTADRALDLNKARNLLAKRQRELSDRVTDLNSQRAILDEARRPAVVDAEKLSSLRSALKERATKMSGGSKGALNDIIEHIDDQVNMNLSPQKQADLAQARTEWRNFKTIEPLLEEATDDLIDPRALMGEVRKNRFINAAKTPTGQDDLVDIARIGKRLIGGKLGDPAGKGLEMTAAASIAATTALNPLAGLSLAIKAGATVAGAKVLQKAVTNQLKIDKMMKGRKTISAKTKKTLGEGLKGIDAAIRTTKDKEILKNLRADRAIVLEMLNRPPEEEK